MRARALLLGLALAACSKAPASTPSPAGEPRPADPTPIVTAADAGSEKGPAMSVDEQVLDAHFEAKGWGKPVDVVRFERVPGLYLAEFSDGGEYVVIRDGKLVETKGLAAAGAYMRDVQLLAHKPEAKDLTTLLGVFQALPPVGHLSPDQFYDFPEHAQLNPKVELAADHARLVLHYLLPRAGHATAHPNQATVMRWTLTIPRDYKLAWREEATKLDTSSP